MSYKTITIGLLIIVGLSLTTSAFAASWWPLVPCGYNNAPSGGDPSINYTKDCSVCDFFRLAKNIIDFILYGLVPPIAVLLFIVAGGLILIGGAYPKNISLGRKIFSNTAVGLLIIFGSWMIANTLIKSFAPNKVATSWFKLECKDPGVLEPGDAPRITSGGWFQGFIETMQNPVLCQSFDAMAKQYGVPAKATNSETLNTLISCVTSNLPSSLMGDIRKYTIDESHPSCNYTRGNPICDSQCSHGVGSCHYGGRTGTNGAEAVDFSFVINKVFKDGEEETTLAEKIMEAVKKCSYKFAQCEKSGKKVECSDHGVDHVHVSTKACDAN